MIVQCFEVRRLAELDKRECFWCGWPQSHHTHEGEFCVKHLVEEDGTEHKVVQIMGYKPTEPMAKIRQARTPWPAEKEVSHGA